MIFLKKLWHNLGRALAFINTTIILTIVYFLIVGCYAMIKKIHRKFYRLSRKSTWQPYLHQSRTLKESKQPF